METASSNNGSRPYLSVVVTARNDDHGGNLLRRMQTFVNALLAQAKRHAVPIELIVVDWNPPPEKPPLIDALQWPDDPNPVEVRFIEVPPELHGVYRHAAALPLYQMIAKNVGIRRARGRFILVTNIDVVFSHELFEFFAQRRLQPGRMYRVDRYDAMEDVPVDASIDEQLRYCEQHLIRINTRQGTFPVTPGGQRLLEPGDIVSPESGISFGKGWYPLEGEEDDRFRWVLDHAELHFGPLKTSRNLILDIEPGPGVGFLPFGLRITNGEGKTIQETVVMRRQEIRVAIDPSQPASKIRLNLLGGGQQVVHDPRILNFRVFSLRWDRPLESGEPGSPAAHVPKAAGLRKPLGQQAQSRPSGGLMRIPRGMWEAFSKLRSATGPVEIGLPLPLFLVERWRLRVQGSGVSVRLDPAWFMPWRRRTSRGPLKPVDLVPDGLNLLWGRGWYAQENYRGEHFRWAREEAEVIVHTPAGEPRTLRLLVEPGPALGYGPFHLRVRDGSGKTCATATVNRRRWIELPLPWRAGATQVLSLQAVGDSPARALPNDSRSLYFRILACAWGGSDSSVGAEGVMSRPQAPWLAVSESPGILLGAGWKAEFPPEGGPPYWSGEPGAEIIVQRQSARRGVLLLDLAPAGEEDVELLVQDGHRPLTSHRLGRREQLRLSPPVAEGQTGVLRLAVGDPVPGLSGKPGFIHLMSAAWRGVGRDHDRRAGGFPEDQSAFGIHGEDSPRSEPGGPAFLHTNACGDFTLLAREHWFDLRGYPEFDAFSMNIDSVFCYTAHHGGAPEEVLPDEMRIYHIEHATGSGFTPEGQKQLFERIAAKGIPWIDYAQVLDWAVQMRRLDAPLIFNLENWGFANAHLVERNLSRSEGVGSAKHSSSSA